MLRNKAIAGMSIVLLCSPLHTSHMNNCTPSLRHHNYQGPKGYRMALSQNKAFNQICSFSLLICTIHTLCFIYHWIFFLKCEYHVDSFQPRCAYLPFKKMYIFGCWRVSLLTLTEWGWSIFTKCKLMANCTNTCTFALPHRYENSVSRERPHDGTADYGHEARIYF